MDDRRRCGDSVAQPGDGTEARMAGAMRGSSAGISSPRSSGEACATTSAARRSGSSRSASVGTRAGVLSPAQRRRRLHPLRSGQDHQLLEDAAVGAVRLHVLGVSARRLREEPEGLREVGRGATTRSTGFRCNMPLGSYFIRKDTSSLLSYTYDGDIISLDPIHAPANASRTAWPTVPEGVQRLGASARRHSAAQSEPVRQEGARRRGVRRPVEEAGRLAPHGRSRPPHGQRVLRRAAVASGFSFRRPQHAARQQQPSPVTADGLPRDHGADGIRARHPAGRAPGAGGARGASPR